MNSDLPPPVFKGSDPLSIFPLQEQWVSQGFREWKDKPLSWLGSDSSRQHYRWLSAEENMQMDVISILSEDEKIIFRAFQDWFNGAIRKASEAMRGYFTFDVLQFEIGDAPWSWNDFSNLLVAHSKKLSIDERRLIQFGTLWGVLQKRTEGDFGKFESKLNLDFCKTSPEAFVRFAKKIMKGLPETVTCVVFRDLSRIAICNSLQEEEVLRALFGEQGENQQKIIYAHLFSKRYLHL